MTSVCMQLYTAYLSLISLCLVTCYLEVENCSILVSNLGLLLFSIATATHTTSHDDTQLVASWSGSKYEVVVFVSAVADQLHCLFVHQHTAALSCVLLVQLDHEQQPHTQLLPCIFVSSHGCFIQLEQAGGRASAAEQGDSTRQSSAGPENRSRQSTTIQEEGVCRLRCCQRKQQQQQSSWKDNQCSFICECMCVSLWLSLTADTRCRKVHGSCQACHGCQEKGAANQPLCGTRFRQHVGPSPSTALSPFPCT